MGFLSQLSVASAETVQAMIRHHFVSSKNPLKQFLQQPKAPSSSFVSCMGFWIEKGGERLDPMKHYIITPTIERHLRDLTRVVLSRSPALLQGF